MDNTVKREREQQKKEAKSSIEKSDRVQNLVVLYTLTQLQNKFYQFFRNRKKEKQREGQSERGRMRKKRFRERERS